MPLSPFEGRPEAGVEGGQSSLCQCLGNYLVFDLISCSGLYVYGHLQTPRFDHPPPTHSLTHHLAITQGSNHSTEADISHVNQICRVKARIGTYRTHAQMPPAARGPNVHGLQWPPPTRTVNASARPLVNRSLSHFSFTFFSAKREKIKTQKTKTGFSFFLSP